MNIIKIPNNLYNYYQLKECILYLANISSINYVILNTSDELALDEINKLYNKYSGNIHIILPIYIHYHSIHQLCRKNIDYNYLKQNKDFNPRKEEYLLNDIDMFLITKRNAKVLFLNSWETTDIYSHKKQIESVFKDKFNIPVNNLFISVTDYKNYNKLNENVILNYDWQYILTKNKFSNMNEKEFNNIMLHYNKKKYYRIISLCRRPNCERFIYCCYLFTHYNSKTIFSFLGNFEKGIKCIKSIKNSLQLPQINKFISNCPFILDKRDKTYGNNIGNLKGTLDDYLDKSYIRVIFETNSQPIKSKSEQISEKTYIGLKSGHPFILFTTKGGIMKFLKNAHGFKTFHPYINEEYDNENLSYKNRYELLLKETERICNLSDEEMNILYQQMKQIVEYNLNVLREKKVDYNILDKILY
jgi:hypothetical protein